MGIRFDDDSVTFRIFNSRLGSKTTTVSTKKVSVSEVTIIWRYRNSIIIIMISQKVDCKFKNC